MCTQLQQEVERLTRENSEMQHRVSSTHSRRSPKDLGLAASSTVQDGARDNLCYMMS